MMANKKPGVRVRIPGVTKLLKVNGDEELLSIHYCGSWSHWVS